MPSCAALILTGGSSSRFHKDKLSAPLLGARVVDRAIAAVGELDIDAFEAGPGYSKLARIADTEGSNPLAAIAKGWLGIQSSAANPPQSVLVVSGDLGNIDACTLSFLVDFPGSFSVVPDDGNFQPLCARWASDALWRAVSIAAEPRVYPVRAALGANQVTWRDTRWREMGVISPFFDVDTGEDLDILRQRLESQ